MSRGRQAIERQRRPRWLHLGLWLLVVAVVSLMGSAVTLPQIPTWYAGLAKPSFTPPNAAFGPVWTVLYVAMAVAAWRVSGVGASPLRNWAITLFVLQLALNAAWSQVFFGLEAIALGLAVSLTLAVALIATVVAFWRIDRFAGILLMPYLAWVCYATVLNAAIVVLN